MCTDFEEYFLTNEAMNAEKSNWFIFGCTVNLRVLITTKLKLDDCATYLMYIPSFESQNMQIKARKTLR